MPHFSGHIPIQGFRLPGAAPGQFGGAPQLQGPVNPNQVPFGVSPITPIGPQRPQTIPVNPVGSPQVAPNPVLQDITPQQFDQFGVPTAPGGAAPPTGLIGSELILGGGLNAAINSLNAGNIGAQNLLGGAISNVNQAGGQATNILGGALGASQLATGVGGNLLGAAQTGVAQGTQQAGNLLGGAINFGQTATGQAGNILSGAGANAFGATGQATNLLGGQLGQSQQATQQALDLLSGGEARGLGQLNQNFSQAISGLSPFIQPGVDATQLSAALSGALGPEAQAQAFQNFQESPGQAFLREQGELSVVNQAAAGGGLGGANFRKRLTEFGQGLALQDLTRQTGQLNLLGGQGAVAQGQASQLGGAQGQAAANLIGQQTQAGASAVQQGSQIGADLTQAQAANIQRGSEIRSNLSTNEAKTLLDGAVLRGDLTQAQANNLQEGNRLNSLLAEASAGNLQEGSRIGAGLSQSQANALIDSARTGAQLSQTGAQISATTGAQGAEASLSIAQDLAAGRTGAAKDIASSIQSVTTALSDLSTQEATALSTILSGGAADVATLLQNAGLTEGASTEQLATVLANIASGQASTSAGVPSIPGTQQTQGNIDEIGKVVAALAMIFSDKRLKINIVKIGQTSKGTNIYKWDWNELGKQLAGDQLEVGVIAQEIQKTNPDAVSMHPSGFLTVDYLRVA